MDYTHAFESKLAYNQNEKHQKNQTKIRIVTNSNNKQDTNEHLKRQARLEKKNTKSQTMSKEKVKLDRRRSQISRRIKETYINNESEILILALAYTHTLQNGKFLIKKKDHKKGEQNGLRTNNVFG